MSDWNNQVIKEFRANGGKVSSHKSPLLLLTTVGARSGQRHTTPLIYLPDADRLIVVASRGGASHDPDWYHNLMAHPEVMVEVGTETFDAIATIVTGEERKQLWTRAVEMLPMLADFQAKTVRQFPLIALQR